LTSIFSFLCSMFDLFRLANFVLYFVFDLRLLITPLISTNFSNKSLYILYPKKWSQCLIFVIDVTKWFQEIKIKILYLLDILWFINSHLFLLCIIFTNIIWLYKKKQLVYRYKESMSKLGQSFWRKMCSKKTLSK
jgi:hypothetical protein